jgi:anti-anti-sigma factor
MNSSILHDDDEGLTTCIGDSGILFENACGTENLRVLQTGEVTIIAFGDRGVRDAACIHTFHDQILELIEQNQCRTLVLDMRGVWFLPSRTLGALMSLRKTVELNSTRCCTCLELTRSSRIHGKHGHGDFDMAVSSFQDRSPDVIRKRFELSRR